MEIINIEARRFGAMICFKDFTPGGGKLIQPKPDPKMADQRRHLPIASKKCQVWHEPLFNHKREEVRDGK